MSALDKISGMLSAHSNYPFCSDCLKLIQSETKFVYEKGILMPSEHMYETYETRSQIQMYETYETRSQIQKTITHAPIEGYDFLIPRMSNFLKPKIRLCGIDSRDECYSIFCDEMFEELIGILKTPGSDRHEY